MRNLGTRFNESNIIEVHGGNETELAQASTILCKAMEVSLNCGFSPSEEKIFDAFIEWYKQIDPKRPYKCSAPAYGYVNLNTGINLLFLIAVPYEGCRGGIINLGALRRVKLVPDQFD